ncbi:MAG: GGDEF domain-containing protein [Gemmataceae bacterium]|nr:GGDEF domain-containing protein [Gemmataceae bacterium]MDW8264279.1 GGDEF domain-containing protein [Gemmataceae bacterium]
MPHEETKVLITSNRTVGEAKLRSACLVHIYPTGPTMGTRYTLGDKPVILGRDPTECDIYVDDEAVSRRHAQIIPTPDGYSITDLQSTNGTHVNHARVTFCPLKDGDYLHIGSTIFRFLAGGNVEAEYHEEIYRLTIIDALTDTYNRRYFLEFLGRSLACATRYGRPLSLLMFDIDHFKSLNDQYGHLAGDAVLRELAARVKKDIRQEDLLARTGGEEFAVVLPETDAAGAREIAERLRCRVASQPFRYGDTLIPVTISVGVTSLTGHEWLTTSELIDQADRRLYAAKHQGRNCVVA